MYVVLYMKTKITFGLFISLFLINSLNAVGQSDTLVAHFDSTDVVLNNFKAHIVYLADDKLRGRATGSKGEQLAYEYIIKQFNEIGLTQIEGDEDYLFPFDFYKGMALGMNNELIVDGESLEVGKDYYPVGQSANATYMGKIIDVQYGIEAKKIKYNNYIKKKKKLKGKVALIDLSNPSPDNPHSDYAPYNGINYRIEKAIDKGAGAVLLYNSNTFMQDPDRDYKIKVSRTPIPIAFLTTDGYQKIKKGTYKNSTLKLKVDLEEINKTGHNVVGYIDNSADHTVVVGGHYDHIGYGTFGSRYTGSPAIHNGADDNASGTAMVIELARWLKGNDLTNYNYMFVAFSGEEMGLYGSKALVKEANFTSEHINYMLNYDMVGRLNEDSVLNINGVGTSSKWEVLNDIEIEGIKDAVTTQSGMGPSDHSSFYLKDIPAIHFFTGAHNDYHKPSDDEELINYNGMRAVFNYTTTLLSELNDEEKLDFKKTKDNNTSSAPKFTVTLGVMPDYVFAGKGMRIDGVSEGKTASKADIKSGDVVIKMGDYQVNDMMSYMEALSKFKKGDKTTVVVKRNDENIEVNVTFE